MIPHVRFDMYHLVEVTQEGIAMALDPIEKEALRRKLADRMTSFAEAGHNVACVSAHYYLDPHSCELCGELHSHEFFVLKNRSGKKLLIGGPCLREMVRFRVVEVDELERWLEKVPALRAEEEKRRDEQAKAREEERRRLEKKFIVRKKTTERAV